MDSFEAIIAWKRMRMRENKNYSFRFVPTRRVIQNSEKIAKKFKYIKKIPLWLHFKPKQVGKGCKREKIKIIVLFRSNPTGNRKFQKNSKKIQIIEKYLYGNISNQNILWADEKIKIIAPFRSIPSRSVIENSKQITKNFKKLKITIMDSFEAIIAWKRMRMRENKNYRSVSFLPDA